MTVNYMEHPQKVVQVDPIIIISYCCNVIIIVMYYI